MQMTCQLAELPRLQRGGYKMRQLTLLGFPDILHIEAELIKQQNSNA